MPNIVGILLAAGEGSRFGGDKLLEPMPAGSGHAMPGTALGVASARRLIGALRQRRRRDGREPRVRRRGHGQRRRMGHRARRYAVDRFGDHSRDRRRGCSERRNRRAVLSGRAWPSGRFLAAPLRCPRIPDGRRRGPIAHRALPRSCHMDRRRRCGRPARCRHARSARRPRRRRAGRAVKRWRPESSRFAAAIRAARFHAPTGPSRRRPR